MELIDWQYYPKWQFCYKKSQYDYGDKSWWEYIIAVGPIQTRWWGKVWPRLVRDAQWSARVKEILLEDLKTVKYNNGESP